MYSDYGDFDGFDVVRTLFFSGGATLVSFPIPIINDSIPEATEQFTVSMSTTDPLAILGPDSAVQINDDDREFCVANKAG